VRVSWRIRKEDKKGEKEERKDLYWDAKNASSFMDERSPGLESLTVLG
jgi:hypothetical protein